VREKYCWLVAGGWFVLREKYCWLVADKPNEHAVDLPVRSAYGAYPLENIVPPIRSTLPTVCMPLLQEIL
jgi:hypothetical protein